jgi:hypothetical protein
MTDDKWGDLIESIRDKFGIDKETTEPIFVESGGQEIEAGKKEIVEFEGASGKMKLERTIKPVVLDKKLLYHKRKDGAKAEYTFSKDEFSYHVDGYIWDETLGDWQKIEAPMEF